MIVTSLWFGATLFYSTKHHVYYATIDGCNQLLFCYDQYDNKNILMGIMNDRIIIGSKPYILNIKQSKQSKSLMEVSLMLL